MAVQSSDSMNALPVYSANVSLPRAIINGKKRRTARRNIVTNAMPMKDCGAMSP